MTDIQLDQLRQRRDGARRGVVEPVAGVTLDAKPLCGLRGKTEALELVGGARVLAVR